MQHPTPTVQSWFHAPTFTATHCIIDPQTKHRAILDSVLDFDDASGCTNSIRRQRAVPCDPVALLAHLRPSPDGRGMCFAAALVLRHFFRSTHTR